jgi:hypothetical protein
MTRSVEEVESDVAAARTAWQDAVEASRLARLAAEDLRRRAIADDSTVSAAALAAAEDEAKFAELKIEARKQATMTLEGELRSARAERFADEFETAIQSLSEDFDRSLIELEGALLRVVTAWRAHASLMNSTYQAAAGIDRSASPRVRFPAIGHPSVGRYQLRAIEVFGPVETLVQKSLSGLNTPLR